MRMKNKILLGVSGVKGVKTIVFLFLSLLMILPLSSCYNKENREEILKVYNWADYIDEDVLANFPKWYEKSRPRINIFQRVTKEGISV